MSPRVPGAPRTSTGGALNAGRRPPPAPRSTPAADTTGATARSQATRQAISRRVRARMAEHAVPIEQLAPLLGMAPATLGQRLAARTSFTAEDLVHIGAALAIPVADLLPPDPHRRTR